MDMNGALIGVLRWLKGKEDKLKEKSDILLGFIDPKLINQNHVHEIIKSSHLIKSDVVQAAIKKISLGLNTGNDELEQGDCIQLDKKQLAQWLNDEDEATIACFSSSRSLVHRSLSAINRYV